MPDLAQPIPANTPRQPAVQSALPAVVHQVLQSPGQPLDAQTRAVMEPRFGHDFSRVRVHADGLSRASTNAMDALAYTVGNHIVLDNSLLSDQPYARQKVMAHELSHVVQQAGAPPDRLSGMGETPALESEAHAASRRVMLGQSAQISSGSVGGLMRMPRSVSNEIIPHVMPDDVLANELAEIDSYLLRKVLSPETIAHLTEVRQQLVTERQRRAGQATPTPARPVTQATPPFFGLQPADDAFRGIQLHYTVATVPGGNIRVQHTFRRGPYLFALHELVLPDGSRRASYYIVFRRPDAILMGGPGWNEYVVGPDSIQLFLGDVNRFAGVGAVSYMFGPPAPYQAASGKVIQRAMEGNWSDAFSSLGDAWVEAAKDPSWWAQWAASLGGAAGRTPGAAPRPGMGGPRPGMGGPGLRSIPGGKPGPVTMRPGIGGRPVVASPRMATAPRVAAPVAQAGFAAEGNAAVKLAPAPLLEPLPATAPPNPLRLVPNTPTPAAPGISPGISPAQVTGVVAGSVAHAPGTAQPTTTPTTTPAPAPAPDPAPDPDPNRRPPMQVILELPFEKAAHAHLYRALVMARRLEHTPNKARKTAQGGRWDRQLRPHGPMGMPEETWQQFDSMGVSEARRLRPNWTRSVEHMDMQVDHRVEWQVLGPGDETWGDSIMNYELLDQPSNAAAGPRLQGNIRRERVRLAALHGPQMLTQRLVFTHVVVPVGASTAMRWLPEDIQSGEHLQALKRLQRHR